MAYEASAGGDADLMNADEGSTMIGKSVTIRGELTGSEDLFLDGTFDGTVTLTESRLTVGANAHVKAELRVKDLIVFGAVEGNIHASGRIELRQTAIVQGDIFASRLSVEESASIRGRVELTGTGGAASTKE